jgi:sialidase-1
LQISTGGSQICAPSALSAGFHHLAGVRAGGTLLLYVDGVLVAQGGASVGLISPTAPLVIGQVSPAFNGEYFNGVIDEVAVHNRALTSTEISRIFGAGTMGMCR